MGKGGLGPGSGCAGPWVRLWESWAHIVGKLGSGCGIAGLTLWAKSAKGVLDLASAVEPLDSLSQAGETLAAEITNTCEHANQHAGRKTCPRCDEVHSSTHKHYALMSHQLRRSTILKSNGSNGYHVKNIEM